MRYLEIWYHNRARPGPYLQALHDEGMDEIGRIQEVVTLLGGIAVLKDGIPPDMEGRERI